MASALRQIVVVVLSTYIVAGCFTRERDEEAAEKKAEKKAEAPRPMCGEKPCLPIPVGIKGLHFGMTRAEAEAALGSPLIDADPLRVAPVSETPDYLSLGFPATSDVVQRPVPGSRASLETTLGSEKAECMVHFDTDAKVTGIVCTIGWDVEDIDTVRQTISDNLIRRYGEPHEVTHRDAHWVSPDASLHLRRAFHGLEVENFSARYVETIAATRREAQWATEEAKEKERREEAARAAEAAKRREEAADALDRDLGGAAEKPR